MLKDFIKQAEKNSLFSVKIFDGQILIRGRLLSPSESEAAALNSTHLISQIVNQEGKSVGGLRDLSEQLTKGDVTNEALDEAYKFLSKLKPNQLKSIADQQNKIICQVIKDASMDDGQTWEELKIVLHQEEQNSDRNFLWVGMLSASDRTEILNQAMTGHREAVEKLSMFRTG